MIPKLLNEPEAIGGTTVTHLINTGGMANIYMGENAGRPVVVKRLKPRYQSSDRVVQMFVDEGRILSHLSHPAIVEFFSAGKTTDGPYIEMEYIDGEQLNVICRRGLHQGRFMPTDVAVAIMKDAAEGLAYFHGVADEDGPLSIVHCDISPTNLLIAKSGGLKIIDFGIALARFQDQQGARIFPGKLSYMSPEQVKRQPIGAASDVFSLGIVFYEITVGKRLFRGDAKEVVKRISEGDIARPRDVHADFPSPLEDVILAMLERDPSKRIDSGMALVEAMASLDDDLVASKEVVSDYIDTVVHPGDKRRVRATTWSDLSASGQQLAQVLPINKGDFMDVTTAERETAVEQTQVEDTSGEDIPIIAFVLFAMIVGGVVFGLFALF